MVSRIANVHRVYNLLERGGNVLAEVAAHKTQLAAIELNCV